MREDVPGRPLTVDKAVDIKEQVYPQIRNRYFLALNYLSIYAFIIVVYGGSLLTEYFLILLIQWLLKEDVQRYPLVALWFDYAKIGLALLLIIVATAHGIIATIRQIRTDIVLSKEDKEIE